MPLDTTLVAVLPLGPLFHEGAQNFQLINLITLPL
jgi:hypothetical protein